MSPSKKAAPADDTVTNQASDSERFVQGRDFTGNFTIHTGDRYEVSADDSPEKKFSVAKDFLDGDLPRRAEALIKDTVGGGLRTNEVAYYWTISTLSDRSFELLEPEQFNDLIGARRLLERNTPDEWSQALDVITGLVGCLDEQERTGDFDARRFDGILRDNARLPSDRRNEIRRHLDLILTGGIQDRFDAESAGEVRCQRMLNRTGRVWKFFEPVPEPPRPRMPKKPVLTPLARAMGIAGGVLIGAGLVLSLGLLKLANAETALIVAVVFVLAALVVACLASGQFPRRYSLYDLPPGMPPIELELYVKANIERRFDECAPGVGGDQVGWRHATHQVKKDLERELLAQYAHPRITPAAIGWLIKWHAENAAREWAAGRLKAQDPTFVRVVFRGAVALLGLVSLFSLYTMLHMESDIAGVALMWLVVGGVLLALSRVDSHLIRARRFVAENDAAERRRTAVRQAYGEWSALLADRPTDDEMARWLDYDKIYLKTLAMNQYGLASREVVAHAVLTEGARGARLARFRYGRARYSAYLVWLFLLTEAGVRQMVVYLDFETGVARDQQRTTFRYDSIASARVTEFGIRFDAGHREIILPVESGGRRTGGKGERERPVTSLIFSQTFRLSLTNGQDIDIAVENLQEGLLERIEDDPDSLESPVADIADVTGAMGILEAVAADGREWITKARARRRRRMRQQEPDASDGFTGDHLTRSP